MQPATIITMIIVIGAVVVATIIMYRMSKKAQKQRDEQQAQLDAAAQQITMLVIDKKKMRLRDAGLPAVVMEQTPKRYHRAKLPIVKAKVGAKIMTFICEKDIFEIVPTQKQVKATVSGLFLTNVKGMRGGLETPPEKKKGFFRRMLP